MHGEKLSLRILLILHSLSALSQDSALELKKLSEWARVDLNAMRGLIEELKKSGYVETSDGRVFLSKRGIIKIVSLYS